MSDVAIRCTDLSKTFRVPRSEHATLRGRLLHPRTRTRFTELNALEDVTFDVAHGEFFGIVGRNGSGKSTLLKLLAGIYKADTGGVAVNGSLAPFIELGVGFNEDLSGLDNVYVNGAILGLTRPEIEERLPHIIRFAELEGFMQLKLRNFSSGMMMRLAFAIAVQADADILLVDEVLAVGDERFQRKCQDVFRERRRRGQTVIFVSHDMSAVESFCDRALLLHEGRLVAMGPTGDVVPEYHRVNRSSSGAGDGVEAEQAEREERPKDDGEPWLELGWGSRSRDAGKWPEGETLPLEVEAYLLSHLTDPQLRVLITNESGGVVGEVRCALEDLGAGRSGALIAISNVLARGRYQLFGELHAWTSHGEARCIAATAEVDVEIDGAARTGSTRFDFELSPLRSSVGS